MKKSRLLAVLAGTALTASALLFFVLGLAPAYGKTNFTSLPKSYKGYTSYTASTPYVVPTPTVAPTLPPPEESPEAAGDTAETDSIDGESVEPEENIEPKESAEPEESAEEAEAEPAAQETPAPQEKTDGILSGEPAADPEEEEKASLQIPLTLPATANPITYVERVFEEKDYYIAENQERYAAFMEARSDIAEEQAIAYVNIRVDAGYYNDIETNENPEDLLVLCNKNHQLPSDYVPDNLRKVAGTNYLFRSDAADAYELMIADMSAAGLQLVVYSTYRSYDYQKNLYARYVSYDGVAVADTYSARAGHSEHQTGLAIDFLHTWGYSSMSAANFQDTDQYAWLLENAYRYGFIQRYPAEYVDITGYKFEPWHWRYIGTEAATFMHDNNITTFEEFWGRYLIV